MPEEAILGLDISTSCIGLTVLGANGKPLLITALDFKNKNKFPSYFQKAKSVENAILKLKKEYNITKIAIESALFMFRPGASSAATISSLIRFNGIVSWILYEIFSFEPIFISSGTARKACSIKIPKGKKAKLVVMEHLQKDEQFLPYITYTKNGSIKPNVFDMADSYVIARAAFLTNQN